MEPKTGFFGNNAISLIYRYGASDEVCGNGSGAEGFENLHYGGVGNAFSAFEF